MATDDRTQGSGRGGNEPRGAQAGQVPVGGERGRTQGGEAQGQGGQGQGLQRQGQGGQVVRRREPGLSRELGFGLDPFEGLGLGGSPFGIMRRMIEDMDRMFESFRFGGGGGGLGLERGQRGGGLGEQLWAPPIEVLQKENQIVVRAELPGLRKEDVNLEIRDGQLVLSGERRIEREEDQGQVHRSERRYGSFYRAIGLPEGVDIEDANATFEDGILEVVLSHKARQGGRKIEIGAGGGGRTQGGGQSIKH